MAAAPVPAPNAVPLRSQPGLRVAVDHGRVATINPAVLGQPHLPYGSLPPAPPEWEEALPSQEPSLTMGASAVD
ncbi:Structural maintenance of chromosomes protein 3, partial [Ascosphaera pollenicola]